MQDDEPQWGPSPLEPLVHRMAPGPERSRLRSQTYAGVASAMARQWGRLFI